MIVLVVYILSILFSVILSLWIFVPVIAGLPPVPTKPERIRKALKLANVQADEVLYDLGAGDGRVLLIAAREFGARTIGVEVGPIQCIWIWLQALATGLGNRVRVRWANLYKTDLHDADVVFFYATSKEVVKLAPHLEQQLKKGARVISISADFPEWEPAAFDERDLIFLYEIPPTRGNMMSYMLKKAN